MNRIGGIRSTPAENGRFHGETIVNVLAERLGKRAALTR